MALKDLLVHLDDTAACTHRVNAALAVAAQHGASVTGVALLLEAPISRYVGLEIPPSVDRAQEEAMRKSADQAIAKLETAAKSAGVACTTRRVTCGVTSAPAQLAYYARHADMTFMGQPDSDDASASFQDALLDGVLFASGRPVYVVPYIGEQRMRKPKAVIAWDGGKKAVRAINDAIPLLQKRGGEVTVLVINPDQRRGAHSDQPGADIAAHLERHGIKPHVERQKIKQVSVDTAILNHLSDVGADLLIMGAYGHSRLRERAFGGVTHSILHHMTTPVLMSE